MSAMIAAISGIVSGHIRYTSAAWAATSRAGFGQAAEVERRRDRQSGRPSSSGPIDGDPRGVEPDVVELAVMVDRGPGEQRAQDRHHLERAGVAGVAGELRAGQVRADDVDRQAAVEHLVEAGELAGELRRPHLATADGQQQLDPLGDRCDPAGERHPVDAERVPRRQQHVVEPVGLGRGHDVTAVRPRRPQCGVGHAEVLVVVVAQRREPGDLRTARSSHGIASPRAATRISYHSSRVSSTSTARAHSRMRAGCCVPMIGTTPAG